MSKFLSRKFLIAVAAFLGSIGASIAGLCIAIPALTITGLICSIVSAALYAACEAYVDGKAVGYVDSIVASEEDIRS